MATRIAGQSRKREVTPFERAIAATAKAEGVPVALLRREVLALKSIRAAERVIASENYTPTPLLSIDDLAEDDEKERN